VLREVLHDAVESVVVELVLVKEEQDQETSERFLIKHLLAALLCTATSLRSLV
jgi:hypothetical protein